MRARGRPKKSGKRTMIRLDLDIASRLPADRSDERNELINRAIREYLLQKIDKLKP